MGFFGRELRSHLSSEGTLRLYLEETETDEPQDDELVVRIEAAPINPSDLGLLIGPADIDSLRTVDDHPAGLMFTVPNARLQALKGRLNQSLSVGNEGAGKVIAAGRDAKEFEGKRVALLAGAMYADYRKVRASEVTVLPANVTAAQGASLFVNPLTALGFVETARRESHTAIVHTVGASNLGRMLRELCKTDGIPLIEIVRSNDNLVRLQNEGASIVLNSTDESFHADLIAAIKQTKATIAFDAIGGGSLGSTTLQAMEAAAASEMVEFNRYGSDTFKQLYIYGTLDFSPTILNRRPIGYNWSVSGWLLPQFLRKIGQEEERRLRERVLDELTTTFASHYTKTIGLAEALDPDVLRAYEKKASGEKFLIDPTAG